MSEMAPTAEAPNKNEGKGFADLEAQLDAESRANASYPGYADLEAEIRAEAQKPGEAYEGFVFDGKDLTVDPNEGKGFADLEAQLDEESRANASYPGFDFSGQGEAGQGASVEAHTTSETAHGEAKKGLASRTVSRLVNIGKR